MLKTQDAPSRPPLLQETPPLLQATPGLRCCLQDTRPLGSVGRRQLPCAGHAAAGGLVHSTRAFGYLPTHAQLCTSRWHFKDPQLPRAMKRAMKAGPNACDCMRFKGVYLSGRKKIG